MLKNMKIGKKLIITFILVTLISSVGGIVGFSTMRIMNAQYSGAMKNYGFAQGEIGLVNTEFNHNLTLMRDIIIQTDDNGMQKSKDELDQSNAQLNLYLKRMEPDLVNSKERNYYNAIKSSLANYSIAQEEVTQLAFCNKRSAAYQAMVQKCNPLSDKVRSAVESLLEEKTTGGNKIAAELNSQANTASATMFMVIIAAMLLSIFIAIRISRGISKPVSELLKSAQKMTEGDLSTEIAVKSKDEIGQLSAAFSEMAHTLNTYITDIREKLTRVEEGDLTVANSFEYKGDFVQLDDSIRGIVQFMSNTIAGMKEASEQVARGSEQVSSGAQALAQGAAEQASSTEELSASIMEISDQVKENSAHVERASVNVNDVSAEIAICNEHMQQMVQEMSKISDSSNQIGKIIKVIENIAFQTNILALNAAVEAARAGSAGKGFAVVADEVRNLASKSAEAAKNSANLIRSSLSEVESGTKIANETAESLLRVVENAKAVSETVGYISDSTAKQSEAIQQVDIGVEQISNVVQTNSATAEESAAASEELSGQAKNMEALAKKFKLKVESATESFMEN